MQFKNTATRYGAVTKFFHWTIALLIIALLCVGLYMVNAEKSAAIFAFYNIHKSTGILVLALAFCRVCWHLYTHTPGFVETVKPLERLAATAVHYYLYFCMFAMPMTGWLFSSAKGRTVNFYKLFDLPNLIGPDKELGETLEMLHGYIAYSLIAVICLHAAGALKHFIIDKDVTLQRMLPFGTCALDKKTQENGKQA